MFREEKRSKRDGGEAGEDGGVNGVLFKCAF